MYTDLVKMILDPYVFKHTCFLCYKESEEVKNIYSDLVIIDKTVEFSISIWNIMVSLFPSVDRLLEQVCDKCSTIIISIYTLMQQYSLKKQSLLKIVTKLENEIGMVKEIDGKCYLRIAEDHTNLTNVNEIDLLKENHQECSKCEMKFELKEQLQEHSNIVHKNTNKASVCHICGKSCKTPRALKVHLNCHSKKQCPYCLKLLKTHSHYKIHVQNHATVIKRKRNHTLYNCHNCSFVSFNKGSLEAHINKAHLGVRPHVCPTCHKGFFKKSNLTEHIQIHENHKNKTCEVCGENFVNKKTLMEHLRLHKNETPYECDVCFKKFVTSGRRSDHIKRKHMEKTECCMFCSKMFSLKKELNRHVKKLHGQISMPEVIRNVDDCANVNISATII